MSAEKMKTSFFSLLGLYVIGKERSEYSHYNAHMPRSTITLARGFITVLFNAHL